MILESLKKTIGKSELTTMNESEISIYKGDNVIQNQGEETSNSNQSLKSSTIKAKSFSIKIDFFKIVFIIKITMKFCCWFK